MEGCVHECQHPLWGGDGICLGHDDDKAPAVCSCDAGFASRDAFGNASCVPTRVLVTGYLVLTIASVLTAALLVWHAYQYLNLTVRSRHARRTAIRMRMLVAASIFVIGYLGIGIFLAVRAGETGLYDAGVLQISYIVLLPSTMFGTSMAANFWVESLPSQLFSPESFAGKLRIAAEKHSLFVVIGVLNAGTIAALGVMTFFVPAWPQLVTDLAIAVGGVTGVTVIIFVAVQITRVINRSISKGSASSQAFYIKAKKNVRVQASAFVILGAILFVVTAIKQLTLAGRSTPIILWTIQTLVAHSCSALFICLTQFEKPSGGAGGVTSAGGATSLFGSRPGSTSFAHAAPAVELAPCTWKEMILRSLAGQCGSRLRPQQDQPHEFNRGIGGGDYNEDILLPITIKPEDRLMAKRHHKIIKGSIVLPSVG